MFEAGDWVVERTEFPRSKPTCPLPEIVAGQADMRPAHGRKMGKQRIVETDAIRFEVLSGAVHVDGVPIGDGGDQQVEARRSIFLIFKRAVREPPLTVGVDRGGKGMAGL